MGPPGNNSRPFLVLAAALTAVEAADNGLQAAKFANCRQCVYPGPGGWNCVPAEVTTDATGSLFVSDLQFFFTSISFLGLAESQACRPPEA